MNDAVSSSCGKYRSAFTMVEIIIAITIMAIMASVAVLCCRSGVSYASLQCAADRVTADLQYVCDSAMRDQASYTVTFDVGNLHYGVAGLQRGHEVSDIQVDLSDSPYHLSNLSLSLGGLTQITYDRNGLASPSGKIVLTKDRKNIQIRVQENGQVDVL